MWWTRNNNNGKKSGPKCPTCVTHPALVKSGYGDEKSLKCPVCRTLFDSNGVRYDPNKKKKEGARKFSIEEDLIQEQEELWDYLWGK